MIIHIAGASGSGKTVLGNKLKEHYGNKIIVIDMDDIMEIFIEKHIKGIASTEQFAIKYQQFIDEYREQLSKKYSNIVFVGLNAFVVNESHYYENELGIEKSIKLPKKYFNLQSDYNFYIDLSSSEIIKQMFYRGYDKHIDWFCKWMKDRKDIVFNELIKNEDKAQKDISIAINRLFDFTDINKNIVTWNKFYKNKGYEFLSREEIYDKIIKLIDGSVQQIEYQKGGNYYNKYLKYKTKYTKIMKQVGNGKTKEIYLIRHGETDWNKQKLSMGQEADIKLNELGKEQARKTGLYLKKYRLDKQFDCIYASPMKRAKETVEIIKDIIGFKDDIIFDDRLKEAKIGKFSGIPKDDPLFQKYSKREKEEMSKDPIEKYIQKTTISEKLSQELEIGEESETDIQIRATEIIDEILKSNCNKIMVVSHGNLLLSLLRKLFKVPMVPPGNLDNGGNCFISLIKYDDKNGFTIISPPDTEHLGL